MWYNLLAQTANKERMVGVGEAALYALLGFAIVFLGIAFLILVVWLVGKAMGKTERLSSKKNNASGIEIPCDKPITEEEISEETIAVITAAIMAYYEQTKPKCEFRVKRIKKI